MNIKNLTTWVEKNLQNILNSVFHLNITDTTCKNLVQFIKFGIVGLSNTVIGYIIYAASLIFFRATHIFSNTDIYIAQLVMFLLSVLWSFYWNNKAVFITENGEQRNIVKALIKTYITYAFTSLFLSEILLALWVDFLGISEFVAPIINLIITVPLNFIIQKFWAFSPKKALEKSQIHDAELDNKKER